MEAFAYQQQFHSFLLDSLYLQDSPIDHHSNASSSCFTTSDLDAPKPTQTPTSENKKRKQSDGSCLSTGQTKGHVKETSKSRRQKKTEDLKKKKPTKPESTEDQPPSGFIHVRARRGQATDSHSLAERVRRERISERMKKLQGLVPGCDKVIGKALVLDEIINYVQSLQNQVEFLSMKLASLSPILYDFGVGFDEFISQPEEMGSMSQPMPPIAFEGATSNFQVLMDSSAAFSLHGHGPTALIGSDHQDSGSFVMQVGDHSRAFVSQAQLNSMCSFQ